MVGQEVEKYLERLVGQLAIPESRYEQAERSYKSLGAWLHREESSIADLDPEVYVQGSFNLGTAIKPLSGKDDYDIDAVCNVRALEKTDLSQADLKDKIGAEVKSYARAQNMSATPVEGRRCWTLEYADGAQFHMDVLPSVPNTAALRVKEAMGIAGLYPETGIAITDTKHPQYYVSNTDDWPQSNPKGYAEWFRARMSEQLRQKKQQFVESQGRRGIRASVEDVPDFRVRTPLQSAIMLLKRHRDTTFNGNPDNKPISIIISTLAAQAYKGEETIVAALKRIVHDMPLYIEKRACVSYVANPTDALENFADKWAEYPEREEAFQDWLVQCRKDLNGMIRAENRTLLEHYYDRKFFPVPASRNGLLKPAGAAAAVGAVSFGAQARKPTKPQGFA
jgi:hypothetical protein